MSKVIGVVVTIIGFLAALYVGLYVMFIGGIIQVVDAVKDDPIPAGSLAWGIARIVFASLVGWLIAAGGIGLGGLIASNSK
jgi:hypothetical protein